MSNMQNIKLSKRLKAISRLVTDVKTMVDIGCDHAYLPIYLVKNKIIDRAIATDISRGAIDIAVNNIKKNGLENQIKTYLCDGIQNIDVSSYECMNISGMGGITIINILKDSREKLNTFKKFILSPQSEEEEFLEGIKSLGLEVYDEEFIKDNNKFYHIYLIKNGKYNNYTNGKFLKGNPVYLEYLESRISKYKKIIEENKYSTNLEEVKDKLSTYLKRKEDYEG